MPIYEYGCKKCGDEFTVLRLARSREEAVCPSCGSKDVVKKVSAFSSYFGSGSAGSGNFYGGGGYGGG